MKSSAVLMNIDCLLRHCDLLSRLARLLALVVSMHRFAITESALATASGQTAHLRALWTVLGRSLYGLMNLEKLGRAGLKHAQAILGSVHGVRPEIAFQEADKCTCRSPANSVK